MSKTWYGDAAPPPKVSLGPVHWLGLIVKLPLLVVLVFGGLAVLLVVRLFERPLFGMHRPITPGLTVFVCRMALRIMGIRLIVHGQVAAGTSALVANHSSWLDIFALNAVTRVYFVSKSEVARWPGIGWLAKATGTVFIDRDRGKAVEQTETFRARLAAGHTLLFFPEATSSDGQRVLPFKSTLFAAFFDQGLQQPVAIQPVSVVYAAPPGRDPRFFGWWGDMEFGSHFLTVVAAGRGGAVTITYHPAHTVTAFDNRKDLARACETSVRLGFDLSGAVLPAGSLVEEDVV